MPAELHVTSPLMAGPDVLKIQEKLDALGYAPGPLDGQYGVATASAVVAFQRDHGLDPDGIVGKVTRAALRRAKPRPGGIGEPRVNGSGEAGRKALAEALRHIGVTERLAPLAPEGTLLVSESGIGSHADVLRLAGGGTRCFLVGESLMRQPDVEAATRQLLGN